MRLFHYLFIFFTVIISSAYCYAGDEEIIHYIYLSKQYPSPPPLSLLEKILPDEGIQGARLSTRDNNRSGRMFGYHFELDEVVVDAEANLLQAVEPFLKKGNKLIVADLEAIDLLELAGSPIAKDAIILNIRAGDDDLRINECRKNLFHMIPSLAMRTDALAQYLIWKKWKKWFLVTGKQPIDKAYANAVKHSAKRFGGKIVEERSYKLETGNKRVDSGHQQIQTQMPMFTRGAPEHDVVLVADQSESFGLYLSYRTADPRPVVGTYGLVAAAWHRSFEQYAGTQLQNNFEDFSGRIMTEKDYLAWLAVKLLSKAVVRTEKFNLDEIRKFILSEHLDLAGYKGRPMNFRNWNQQLRQPLLLSSDRALVSVAPLDGFLHPKYYTDTLGYDRGDSKCSLANN